jgi:hypothetical protein
MESVFKKKDGSTHTIDKGSHEYNAFFADQGHYDAKSVSLKELKAPECKPKMFMCYTISQDTSGKYESNDRLMARRHRPTRFELRNADVQGLQFRGFKQPRGRGPITGATGTPLGTFMPYEEDKDDVVDAADLSWSGPSQTNTF